MAPSWWCRAHNRLGPGTACGLRSPEGTTKVCAVRAAQGRGGLGDGGSTKGALLPVAAPRWWDRRPQRDREFPRHPRECSCPPLRKLRARAQRRGCLRFALSPCVGVGKPSSCRAATPCPCPPWGTLLGAATLPFNRSPCSHKGGDLGTFPATRRVAAGTQGLGHGVWWGLHRGHCHPLLWETPCAGWGAGLLPLSPLPGSCPGRASAQGSLPEPQEPPEPSGLSSASVEEAPGRAGVRTAASRMWCVDSGSRSISISRNTMPTAWAGASAAAGPAAQPHSSTLSPPPAAAAGCRQIQPERALRRVPRGSRYRLQAALQAPRPAPHGSLHGFFLVPCHKSLSPCPLPQAHFWAPACSCPPRWWLLCCSLSAGICTFAALQLHLAHHQYPGNPALRRLYEPKGTIRAIIGSAN